MKYFSSELMYWISTMIVVIFLLISAYSYAFQKAAIEGFIDLGFPNFFRIQLIVLKIIAALCLILPFVPMLIKEWAYAGIGIFLLTAIVAHLVHKDSILITMINLVIVGALIISNYCLKL